MRKNQEIVLFDNTNYSERYNEIREELYERFAEEYDWEYSDDVPVDMIHDEMNFHEEIDYHYFKDKMKARKGLTRIPERLLLGVGFFGGSIGALVAMKKHRHKTRHAHFYVINIAGIFAQIAVGALIFFMVI